MAFTRFGSVNIFSGRLNLSGLKSLGEPSNFEPFILGLNCRPGKWNVYRRNLPHEYYFFHDSINIHDEDTYMKNMRYLKMIESAGICRLFDRIDPYNQLTFPVYKGLWHMYALNDSRHMNIENKMIALYSVGLSSKTSYANRYDLMTSNK